MTTEKFLKNFANLFDETDPSEITLSTEFRNLDEWSSLITLSVIAMADEEYDVKHHKRQKVKHKTCIILFLYKIKLF